MQGHCRERMFLYPPEILPFHAKNTCFTVFTPHPAVVREYYYKTPRSIDLCLKVHKYVEAIGIWAPIGKP